MASSPVAKANNRSSLPGPVRPESRKEKFAAKSKRRKHAGRRREKKPTKANVAMHPVVVSEEVFCADEASGRRRSTPTRIS